MRFSNYVGRIKYACISELDIAWLYRFESRFACVCAISSACLCASMSTCVDIRALE